MFKQYFKNNILYLSEKTSINLIGVYYKAKFKYLNKTYIGIIFVYNNNCKIYSKKKIYDLTEITVIKILSNFKLYDGAQIKFRKNNKITKGYIHYFDPSFFLNNTDILVVNYYDYNTTYLINFCNIISNDFTIV